MEVANAFGDEGAIWMTGVLNEAMREGIPEECRQAQYHLSIYRKETPWNVTTSEVLNY